MRSGCRPARARAGRDWRFRRPGWRTRPIWSASTPASTPPKAETTRVAVAMSPAWACDRAKVAAIAVSENENTWKSKASRAQPIADAQNAWTARSLSVRYQSRLTSEDALARAEGAEIDSAERMCIGGPPWYWDTPMPHEPIKAVDPAHAERPT